MLGRTLPERRILLVVLGWAGMACPTLAQELSSTRRIEFARGIDVELGFDDLAREELVALLARVSPEERRRVRRALAALDVRVAERTLDRLLSPFDPPDENGLAERRVEKRDRALRSAFRAFRFALLLHMEASDLDGALRYAERFVESRTRWRAADSPSTDRERQEATLEAARCYLAARRFVRARDLLRELIPPEPRDGAPPPDSPPVRAALHELERLAALAPPEFLSPLDHDALARAANLRGAPEEAIHALRTALRRFDETGLSPGSSIDVQERSLVERYERLTRAFWRTGPSGQKLAAACALFSAWAFHPEPDSIWDLESPSERQASRAAAFAFQAAREDPRQAAIYASWAEEASYLRRVHDRNPPDSTERIAFARVERARGRDEMARWALESIRDPRDLRRFQARVLLGRWAHEDAREEEAAAILEAALDELATCKRHLPGFRAFSEATCEREARALLEEMRK